MYKERMKVIKDEYGTNKEIQRGAKKSADRWKIE